MEPRVGGIITAIDTMIPGGIANLFNIGLGIGAILAFGTLIYAGILYSIAGDNASKQKEAKAWIIAAVKGLALLAFGVVLINIVNPGLRTIEEVEIRDLSPIEIQPLQLTESQRQERLSIRKNSLKEYVVPNNPLVRRHSIIRLRQGDPMWGGEEYGKGCKIIEYINGERVVRGTYSAAGCGPAAIAMAIHFHTGNIQGMAPNEAVVTIGNIAIERGYRICGSGTAWAAMDNIPILPRFNLLSTRVLGQRSIANCFRENGILIALMDDTKSGTRGDQYNTPIFTTSGHYIIINGIDEKKGMVYITDPGGRNVKSSKINHFLNYNQMNWCIKNPLQDVGA